MRQNRIVFFRFALTCTHNSCSSFFPGHSNDGTLWAILRQHKCSSVGKYIHKSNNSYMHNDFKYILMLGSNIAT